MDKLLINLEDIKKKSKEDFLSNYNLYLSAQRALEVCINICIDVENHIISLNENSKAETYAQIFEVLENMKIISKERKERLIQMVKFRNFLGHLYLDIDNEKIYEYIQNNLNDFIDFKKDIYSKFTNELMGNNSNLK